MKVVNIRKNGKIAEKLFRKNRAKYWFAENDNSDPLKLNIFQAPPPTRVSRQSSPFVQFHRRPDGSQRRRLVGKELKTTKEIKFKC
jgi:hypothetical protein